jgi:hypothetical protein
MRGGVLAAAVLSAGASLAGCLERRETITVSPDGSVTIEVVLEGDSERELTEGDAVPSLAGGWLAEAIEEIPPADGHEDPRWRLTAGATFPPDLPLPENFADLGDPRAALYLQFPTTVAIEDRRDGVYYHFHRRYPGRPWAEVESLRELLVDETTKDLKDRKPEELTRDDRRALLRAHGTFEAAKMLVFARQAFLEVSPDAPQDGWLAVAAEVNAHQAAMDYDRILDLADIEDEEERNQALDDDTRRWRDEALEILRDALRRHCDYGGKRLADFTAGYAARRFAFDVTSDLSDEVFEVAVVLPGEIVASNADSAGGGRAAWKFSGRRVRDAGLELMATSRLAP